MNAEYVLRLDDGQGKSSMTRTRVVPATVFGRPK